MWCDVVDVCSDSEIKWCDVVGGEGWLVKAQPVKIRDMVEEMVEPAKLG